MIFLWLLAAIGLTVIGAVITAIFQDAEEEHDEELVYEERIGEQRAALTVAKCAVDPVCRVEHDRATAALIAHKAHHAA